jgi:hypothetical protein
MPFLDYGKCGKNTSMVLLVFLLIGHLQWSGHFQIYIVSAKVTLSTAALSTAQQEVFENLP